MAWRDGRGVEADQNDSINNIIYLEYYTIFADSVVQQKIWDIQNKTDTGDWLAMNSL